MPPIQLPLLLSPLTLRTITAKNRIMLSPMCQYSAGPDGVAGDWHFAHLAKFALGGFGIVTTEATAIAPDGRISWGDLGLWNNDQIAGFRRITDFIRSQGALSAIQLAHAGPKAGSQRPWEGKGPLGPEQWNKGETPFASVGPGDFALEAGYPSPHKLDEDEIPSIVDAFAQAALRADAAGFDIIEIHAGHGYLLASFLSPVSNTRNDGYGGDRAGRMRLTLEVARAIRSNWPSGKPLFCRISTIDGAREGWNVEDSIVLAKELAKCGVDLVDCSSGGLRDSTVLANAREPGFQVPLSASVRHGSGVATGAVGLIIEPGHAEQILSEGDADVILLGRQALYDPFWPHHAAQTLQERSDFEGWNQQSGWWLRHRARSLDSVGLAPNGSARHAAR
ncbi:NADH:flavin oxidoreductase/NADH oxidase [Novosphingobium profundi]|uniref:NADH:flavin oxidoreductase/NADH oxidase n=1 Tax=Novosphingobium profundi TaxID=1774954 RepID=UPI001BDAB4E3|nr:NADH:flavin oxidoreductase/NADH oxidase [Novosphingobium profundi]MBT0667312.1 NADH:flavin oxidoreductase/NADH oxidase [Novosphingobium profundi]